LSELRIADLSIICQALRIFQCTVLNKGTTILSLYLMHPRKLIWKALSLY